MTTKLLNAPLIILPLLLAGCAGGSLIPESQKADRARSDAEKMPAAQRRAAVPRVNAGASNVPFASADARQCVGDLAAAGVKFTPLPDRHEPGGCSAINSIKVLDFGTPTTNMTAMTCPLAKNFAGWTHYAVQPAAEIAFGQKLVKIETMGTYSCRNIYGGRSGR
mgnify:CR=1 FL=1